jgi:type IX secretion system PorP/SprF family membrane protein
MKRPTPYYPTRIAIIMMFALLSVYELKAQQSVQFTQFMFNNLVINPAYAGAEDAPAITVLSRNQWTGVENSPATQSFSAHTLLKKKNIGLGITIIRDQIGVHKNLDVMSNYSYHLRVADKSFISLGLQLGVSNLKSNYSSLAGTSNDPKLVDINETLFGVGAGIYFRSPKFQIGVSVPQLLSKTVQINDTTTLDVRRLNILGNSRYMFSVSDRVEMEPGVMVKYYPDLPLSYDIYWNIIYRKVLTVGASYRKKESVDLILKFQLTPKLQLGYAYDYPIGVVANLSSASHELMINYVFRSIKKRVASPR